MSESRMETLLNALINGEQIDFTPRSRAEQYLKNCIEGCGCGGLPAPKSRMDALLYSLADKIAQGGGGSGGSDIDALIERTVTEINSNAMSVGNYAFYYNYTIKSINLPNATSVGDYAFQRCLYLERVDIPNAVNVGSHAFYNCSRLTNVNSPKLTTIVSDVFAKCEKLTSVHFPEATSATGNSFSYCYALTSVDLPKVTRMSGSVFYRCYMLKRVILRSETMCTLADTYPFGDCSHILGTVHSTYNPNGDKDGYFYVPRALVDTYKSATNWVTYETQFRALEDYTVDGTITGALDESKI